ncbi:hypothetical protein MP228_000984 [Amoeboaphelidium protococcarum]|nr:hypothetical protein MP228_000984 [Amoeboaphelidium protococcarum]
MNFELIQECLSSASFKKEKFDYQLIMGCKPLCKQQVQPYARSYLNDHKYPNVEEIVSRVGDFALCHGRARFIAFIMDRFIECGDIERALSMFMLKINDIQSTTFSLGFFVKDLNEGRDPLMRRVGTETLHTLLIGALISYLTFGNATMLLPNDHASYAVHCGLGFVNSAEDRTLAVVNILKDAVIECLRCFIPFGDIVRHLGHHILTSSQPSNVGYTLEYIVAAALVANNSGDQSMVRRLSVWNNMIESYLLQDYDFDSSAILFSDHMMGPDIIYRCISTRILYLVQVKFVRKLSNYRESLRGFEHRRQSRSKRLA